MAESEDESFSKFQQKIEQKCLSKRAPRKRKQYLGPDSVDIIPRMTKYRYEKSASSQATKDVSSAIDGPGCLQATLDNQIHIGYLSVENEAPVLHTDLPRYQINSDCEQAESSASYHHVTPEIIPDAISSTVFKESSARNDIHPTSSRAYCEQITSAFSAHATKTNRIQVAPLLVEHTTALNLSHCESNSRCNLSASPSDDLVECMANSQDIYDTVTRNPPLNSGRETEANSEMENDGTQSYQSHHQSCSTNRTSSRDSRSPSESSVSLLDSDNESDANEQEEYEQPVNDQDGRGHEERGRGQEEQAAPDQPAGGGEGEEIGRVQDEQQNGEAGEEREREQEEHVHEGGGRPPTHGKLREAMLGGFLNNVEVPIGASRNDMLYMALSLSSRNNETNTAFCKLIEMINCLFVSPVLPSSQYLLDNLLVSDVSAHYHFYCKTCFKSFGELDFKNIKFRICENCNTRNNVSDLRISTFFVIFDLPVQLEIMLSKPELVEALCTPAEAVARSRPGFLSDIYSGSMYQEFCASVANFQERTISMHLSVDGSPISKSSSASIWPIQGEIHELPPNLRMKNLLLCGLWFGKTQPKMDLFLPPFVSHMRTLSQGFQLRAGPNMWDTRLYCVGCCVDSGARGSVQGIKTHGGYFACNWCKICGAYIDNAVRYPLTDRRPDDRTHDEIVMLQRRLLRRRAARAGLLAEGEEMEQELQEEEEEEEEERENNDGPNGPGNPEMLGVISASALLNLPQFSMVNGFFVDNMHCVDMGIVKGQISLWLEGRGMPYYIKLSLPELNRRILALRPPLEFRRMPRILKERLNFKAREYNNFLWYSYIILKDILPNRFLNTWLLLIQAIFLLSQAEVSIQQINIAETLIIHYLAAVQVQYGEKNMSFNLHILRHLAAHVKRWGPLWGTSAYVFEDGNGHLKNLIHTVQCVPHQVIRHWSWDLARQILHPHVSDKARNYAASIFKPKHHNKISYLTGACRLIGKPMLANLSDEETFLCEENQQPVENLQCYDKLIYKNCAYVAESKRCTRTSNSVAQLNDKTVVLIRKILFDTENDRVFLFVSDINWEPIMTLPRGVAMDRDDHCLRDVQFVHEELRFIKFSDLKIICFRTKLPHCDLIAVLPNVQNRN